MDFVVEEVSAVAPIQFVDFDANLLNDQLIQEMDRLMQSAQELNVVFFVIPGSSMEDSAASLEWSKRLPNTIISTCGIHPYNADKIECTEESVSTLRKLLLDDGNQVLYIYIKCYIYQMLSATYIKCYIYQVRFKPLSITCTPTYYIYALHAREGM